jgi:glycosidase
VRASLVTGGGEVRGPIGGLEYPGAREVAVGGGIGGVRAVDVPGGRRFSVDVHTADPERWAVTWHHTLLDGEDDRPAIGSVLEVHARTDDAILRNVRLEVEVRMPEPAAWRVDSPGNPIRRGVPRAELEREVAIATAGNVSGSAGLVAFERSGDPPLTVLVWPVCGDAIGSSLLRPTDGGAMLSWTTDIAGRPGPGGSLTVATLHLDAVAAAYGDVLAGVPDALAALGITSPAAPPEWAVSVSLYEVQVGYGVFAQGYRYGPYPTAADLLADIPRIADLGYGGLQIMPRQPYPSYNVHDYADVTTSWGDEEDIRRIVEACHARGMRVILDILMHGVIDGEVVEETIASIRAGCYADRLDEVIPDITSLDEADPVERHLYPIAWCAHVVNFGPDWAAGSPRRHPLADEHPEWFCRDSAGNITGVYTKAFDLAHPGWQRWFIDAALALVRRLDIDGFRFDAPSYNAFHNWSERTRRTAAVSMLGCLSLFEQLRAELRALKPDALLYTEPSGALYRRTMDMTYDYDEQWLVRAVTTRGAGRRHWVRNARELGRWLADRDASLPRGSLTAHHLDSHDTFWWPHPGRKWRREQVGIPATAALMAVFALSGGPYMTFVGGEVGIEEQVRAVHRLRASSAAFARGASDHDAVDAGDDDVYAVLRRLGRESGVLLVNLSDAERAIRCRVAVPGIDQHRASFSSTDAMGGARLDWSREAEGWWAADLALGPWRAVATVLTSGG